MRDDFSEDIKRVLSSRVVNLCSNPVCQSPTTGPHTSPGRRTNIGVAAHITAAAPGGPRYDPTLSAAERKGIGNAIWLCQNCGKLIDSDELKFPAVLLREWKRGAEERARIYLESGRPSREVAKEIQEQEDRTWLINMTRYLQQKQADAFPVDPGTPDHERAERLVAAGLLERALGLPYNYALAGTFRGFSW